jgi:hypothetical protein
MDLDLGWKGSQWVMDMARRKAEAVEGIGLFCGCILCIWWLWLVMI